MITARTLIPEIKNIEHMPETGFSTEYSACESLASQYVTLLVNLLYSLEVVVNFFIDGWS